MIYNIITFIAYVISWFFLVYKESDHEVRIKQIVGLSFVTFCLFIDYLLLGKVNEQQILSIACYATMNIILLLHFFDKYNEIGRIALTILSSSLCSCFIVKYNEMFSVKSFTDEDIKLIRKRIIEIERREKMANKQE